MEKLQAELTVNEWNLVLQSLSRMPFGDVAALIFKLKGQVDAQIKQESKDGD